MPRAADSRARRARRRSRVHGSDLRGRSSPPAAARPSTQTRRSRPGSTGSRATSGATIDARPDAGERSRQRDHPDRVTRQTRARRRCSTNCTDEQQEARRRARRWLVFAALLWFSLAPAIAIREPYALGEGSWGTAAWQALALSPVIALRSVTSSRFRGSDWGQR